MRARSIAVVAGAWCAAGCSAPQDYLHTAGPAAHRIAVLGWFALLSFSVTIVVMWLLIGWIAVRRRGSFTEHAPIDANGGQRWILVGGLAVPVAVLAILFIATMETLSAFPMQHADQGAGEVCTDAPRIMVTGHQWWFDAEYQFPEPDRNFEVTTELHIPVGKPVDVLLQTRDVIHSFWIPKLHGKVDLVPGQVNQVRIQADRPGVYEGECGEYCGAQHAHMRLQVVAQAQKDYDAWVEQQRKDAAGVPGWDEALRGKQVFMAAACPLCHTVRGTAALGQVGPELTHVGSRRRIGGGMLENNTANLEAWVTHAQSLKPGAQMPDLTQFNGRDLRALVGYLQSLR
jgi:cytochrome c oxidase subunit 2